MAFLVVTVCAVLVSVVCDCLLASLGLAALAALLALTALPGSHSSLANSAQLSRLSLPNLSTIYYYEYTVTTLSPESYIVLDTCPILSMSHTVLDTCPISLAM